METAVEVTNLTKKYGERVAVNNVTFSIGKGEVFGLLGPNGAGKTTTTEMIEGLRKPDAGIITVAGLNVSTNGDRVRELIGVQLQSTALYDRVRVGEAVDLFGSYYRKRLPAADVLARVSLTDRKRSFVETLSGGQKQRLAIALAIVNDPEVVFLDEPTTGLDPQARRNLWGLIEALRDDGKTIVLTTHYMEEAERLCDRVGIIDAGSIIALDTPRNLIAQQKLASAIELIAHNGHDEAILRQLQGVDKVTREGNTIVMHTRRASSVLVDLVHAAEGIGLQLDAISVRKATLEDVFLELTGKRLRE